MKTILVHGSNNGVHVLQPVDVVTTQSGVHEIPWDHQFVFCPRNDPNYPLATGDIALMQRLLPRVKDIDNRGQGWPVPLSNGVVQLEELAGETSNRFIGKVDEVIKFFKLC